MPYGTSDLSSHILFSQFRGPFALNMADGDPVDPPKDPPKDPPQDPPKDPVKDPNDDFKSRLSDLETKNKEYKTKLKEYEDAEKKRKDDELAQKGEHEKLAEQYKNESATEKAARESAESKLRVYEELAQAQIKKTLEAITDAEKKKSAEAMLEGLSTEEQIKRIPSILTLVGTSTGFGNGTPATQLDQRSVDQKRTRYSELLAKPNKTPQEKLETSQLMTELQKVWNEEEAKNKAA